jgi:hypothetical protein
MFGTALKLARNRAARRSRRPWSPAPIRTERRSSASSATARRAAETTGEAPGSDLVRVACVVGY